ncbi:MAG: CAP domain-containing protein [Pseudomonadota bacterium]
MSEPSAYEQYALELINAQRLDPQAAADAYGAGTISATQLQPLAFNLLLNDAAESHSQWLLQTNRFSHTGQGNSTTQDRMEAAGYQFTGDSASEANLALSRSTGFLNPLTALEDQLEALFLNSTTRARMLDPQFREVGLGYEEGRYRQYNATLLNENFAVSGDDKFITGVVYADTDANDQFSYNEGVGGATIRIQPQGGSQEEFTNYATGGYTASTTASGLIDVEFSQGGTTVVVTIEMGVDNVKVDLRDTNFVASSASAFLGDGAVGLELLGINDINATGNDGQNIIIGNSGDNRIAGGEESDILTGNGGADSFVFDNCHDGVDQITDFVSGTDTIEVGRLGFVPTMQIGSLGEDSLVFGTTATQNQAQFLYDQSTGNLSIDMDGTGVGEALLFANLGAGTSLSFSDIVVTDGGRAHSIINQNIITIENNGSYQLAVDADGAYLITNGVGVPVGLQYFATDDVGPASLAGWSALQAEATSTGYTVLWQHTNGGYALWQTDANGNYVSSYDLQEDSLYGLEAMFVVDFDGDGKIGVIEDNGAYELGFNANGEFHVSNAVGAPTVLKYGGPAAEYRSFDGWSALQAEATASGFAVLWLHTNGTYALWQTDADGNYVSSYDLQETSLYGLEAMFDMDFNNDGTIGMIEDNGAFQLSVDAAGAFQVSNGVDTPNVLKYGGSDVQPKTFPGWTVLQAEATDTGFAVLWQHQNGNYALWQTDAAGNYVSSTSPSQASLTNIEALFGADLDGDGGLGVVEDNGAFMLSVNASGAYQIGDGVSAPVVIKNGEADIGPASLVGWSALQAEATATGFAVLWHHTDGRYIVWELDAAGDYQESRLLSDAELNEMEAVFSTDLNGDGGIAVIEDDGAFQLSISNTGAYQFSDGNGAPVVLKNGGTDIGPDSLAGWSAVQADATDTGFAVLWQHTDGRNIVWETDASGNYQASNVPSDAALNEIEAVFGVDLNGDGGIAVIENNGDTELSISDTGAYQFSDGVSAPVGLKNAGADIGPDSLAGWTALQAEATATGFSVLWQHANGNHVVWDTDAAGNFQASRSLSESGLNEIELLFETDLNGDGGIAIVEDNGAIELSIDENGAYQFNDGISASIVLTNGGSDIGPSSMAGWSALQAEATASGFSVLWNHNDGRYVVWETDTQGSYEASFSVAENALSSIETLFQADLDGDGGVGLV